ncbi:MAG: TrkH family potassium uptake protein [Actinomycetota bacterium]|nr:TrkH family potassium uptake protein [Actinomycetota bacterium]
MDARLRAVRLVPVAFLVVIAVGTLLLMLPASRADDGDPFVGTAIFTAVASVCVTGMTVVDTAQFWTPFGHGVILGLVQVGGFGIMTLATLLGVLVSGKLGLRSMVVTQTESHTVHLGDVRGLLRRIAVTVLVFETVISAILTVRFRIAYDDDLGTALWHGVFHGVGSFNNSGYTLYSDNLVSFVGDAWICLTISVAVIAGGIGFPVLAELMRRTHPDRWTIHTRITVYGTLILLLVGIGGVAVFEWTNPGTLGPLSWGDKLTAATTTGVMPRTGGYNSIDYSQVRPETLATTIVLMFIGGGSGGTAGGIKVTTFFLLAYVIWAEIRGNDEVTVGPREVPRNAQRQALTIALLGVGVIAAGNLALLVLTDLPLEVALFEATAAFTTAGISSGVTAELPGTAQAVLLVLMFVGRVGTITVASALALRGRQRLYRLPEERPIIG